MIENYFHPYVSLNESLLVELQLDLDSVESSLAEALLKIPGVRAAVTASDIKSGALPSTEVFHSITQNFHPSRSGNIHLVFEPNIFVNDFDGLVVASSHGSPWEYDRHVPIIIAGKGIPHGRSTRPVTPYALAPTLAQLLGIAAPSGSVDERLSEVLPQ